MRIIKISNNDSLEKAIDNYTGKRLKGGLSDKDKIKDYPKQSLKEGVDVEIEHTNDINLALEIAMDHLSEDKSYYKKLKEIEK